MIPLESLFPYQELGARWLASTPQALLADGMGLGKSAQAVSACDLVGARSILVVCPAVARVNWIREFEKFSPLSRDVIPVFSRKDIVPDSPCVVVCSYDLVRSLKTRIWDVLILDEAHFLKERTAKRTKAIYGKKGIQARHVWRLTGTPAPNNAAELWTHLKSAGITEESYWDFAFRYCTGFDTTYGFKITGHKNVEELKRMLSPFILRRTGEEVLQDLPPIRYQNVTVERSDVVFELDTPTIVDEIKVGEQTLSQALAALRGTQEQVEASTLALLEANGPALATLRRHIALAKTPAICDILAEELKTGILQKVVVFGIHKDALSTVQSRLENFGAVSLVGSTSQDQRQKNIDRFMNDPDCRVFVGNIQAAGTAITLTSASECVFLEQSWVPSENAQAAKRLHRIGQTVPVRVRVFSLFGSVDERVQTALTRKARELSKIF